MIDKIRVGFTNSRESSGSLITISESDMKIGMADVILNSESVMSASSNDEAKVVSVYFNDVWLDKPIKSHNSDRLFAGEIIIINPNT